jgi:hypothetical protein
MEKSLQAFILLVFVSFVCSEIPLVNTTESSAATAIAAIVENYENFDFIVYGSPLEGLVNEISILTGKPMKIRKIDRHSNVLKIRQSAFLFFSDIFLFYEFYDMSILANEYPRNFHFFVYIKNFNRRDLDYLVPATPLNPHLLYRFINFVLEYQNDDSIDLVTFTTFQQPNCRTFNRVNINRFSKATRKWENRRFSAEKFRSFNGCELVVFKFIPTPIYLSKIHDIISSKLNFSSKTIDSVSQKEQLSENIPRDFSLFLSSFRIVLWSQVKNKTIGKNTITHHVTVYDRIFLVSRSAPYSMLEKALLPLDDAVWFWLIGFAVVGVIIIIAVSFTKKKIREFVFGLNVRVPLLNLV